ncbi:STAS domain-containing protein [Metabacillus sp. RGM 3146]|uniref:STAS domain-containing protein n=1 Tax=Metabacillus sp. RGM 3146 TaxID=3401092 RepID=UPI003B999DF3
MEINLVLRNFLVDNADRLTEEWYATLEEKDPSSVYASTDLEAVAALKAQNNEFHLFAADILVEDEETFMDRFNVWVNKIAHDSAHLKTPTHQIIREFTRTRSQYFDYIHKFYELHKDKVAPMQLIDWKNKFIQVIDAAILNFVEEAHKNSAIQLKAQQEMIYELSSPVITLANNQALLPLVGDIDTSRAKIILENTLEQCAAKKVHHLYIDLSGVVIIDTMVAHQIFQLISTLNLIGVKSTLSGIRPEIAMTALQLGLSFDKTHVVSTLSQALEKNKSIH